MGFRPFLVFACYITGFGSFIFYTFQLLYTIHFIFKNQ